MLCAAQPSACARVYLRTYTCAHTCTCKRLGQVLGCSLRAYVHVVQAAAARARGYGRMRSRSPSPAVLPRGLQPREVRRRREAPRRRVASARRARWHRGLRARRAGAGRRSCQQRTPRRAARRPRGPWRWQRPRARAAAASPPADRAAPGRHGSGSVHHACGAHACGAHTAVACQTIGTCIAACMACACAAWWSGVWPSEAGALTRASSAAHESRTRSSSACPELAARCSAVQPLEASRTVTSTPVTHARRRPWHQGAPQLVWQGSPHLSR